MVLITKLIAFAIMAAQDDIATQPPQTPPPTEPTAQSPQAPSGDSIVVDLSMGDSPSPDPSSKDALANVELGVEDMMSIPPLLIDKPPEVSAYLVEEVLTEADVDVVVDDDDKDD